MTSKFEHITADEIKLNEQGNLELSSEMQDVVAGGISPEEAEEEGIVTNNCSVTINKECSVKQV